MANADTVTIVTPTTGHPNLHALLLSVQAQRHPHVIHLLVIDGPEHERAVRQVLAQPRPERHPLHVLALPWPTGHDRFNGHRIYGAASFLCPSAFVSFLDEDNSLEPDHLEGMITALGSANADWAYSLRRIVDRDGRPITVDHCESLGPLHPVVYDKTIHHIDTSCYLLPAELAAAVSPLWHRRLTSNGGNTPDGIICRHLMRHAPRAACSLRYSVNYRVGNSPTSVKAEFFLRGNAAMRQRYPEGLPWEQATQRR